MFLKSPYYSLFVGGMQGHIPIEYQFSPVTVPLNTIEMGRI
jgi:hypothetical protein